MVVLLVLYYKIYKRSLNFLQWSNLKSFCKDSNISQKEVEFLESIPNEVFYFLLAFVGLLGLITFCVQLIDITSELKIQLKDCFSEDKVGRIANIYRPVRLEFLVLILGATLMILSPAISYEVYADRFNN